MINLVTSAMNAAIVGGAMFIGTADYKEYVTARECLALNIYHEARSESEEGQAAVGFVTLNRVEHSYFPDTVCDVVYDKYQFSWTHDGLSDRATDTEAYVEALLVAAKVMDGSLEDITSGSLFYHANYVNPDWVDSVDYAVTIGDHIFYTWNGRW